MFFTTSFSITCFPAARCPSPALFAAHRFNSFLNHVHSTWFSLQSNKDLTIDGKSRNITNKFLLKPIIADLFVLTRDQISVLGSPFVYAFRHAGLNGAAMIGNIPVLSSELMSGNYFAYGCARYIRSMAKFSQASKICTKASKRGVPIVVALCISTAFALIGIVSEFVVENTVYLFLIYFIGRNIFLYTVICLSQYRFRKRYIAKGGKVEDITFKVASYPLIPHSRYSFVPGGVGYHTGGSQRGDGDLYLRPLRTSIQKRKTSRH